jgi:hypothetical protein
MAADTPEIVCYGHATGVRVEIRRADALEISADVAIIGKSPPLHKHLQELTGMFFQPFESPQYRGLRRITTLQSNEFTWKRIFSMHYNSRRVKPDSLHTHQLCHDIYNLMTALCECYKPRTVLILPLSCRNPEIIAIATTQAIARFAYDIALRLEMTRSDRWFKRYMSSLSRTTFRSHPEILNQIRTKEAQRQKKLRELDKNVRRPTFCLVDKMDPSPFITTLEGTDPQSTQFLETWGPSCLREIPFTRTEPGAENQKE